MAYNYSNFLNSIAPKKTSTSSAFGNTDGGLFNKINSFTNKLQSPQSSYMNSKLSTPSSSAWQGPVKPTTAKTVPTTTNAGATNTTATKISSPAGKQYVNGMSSTQTTAPTNTFNAPSISTPTPEQNPYLKYLSSLFDSEATTKAGKDLSSANERLAGIQSLGEQRALSGRREYESLLNASGGLKSGAEMSASRSGDRTNSALADLAVQESAAGRSAQVAKDTYDMYINAGKTAYEAETAANKAKQDQDNIDRTFEENKRQFGMEYALKQKELAIQQQKANADSIPTQTGSYRENSMNNINNYVDEALKQIKPGSAGFGSGLLGAIRGSNASDLKSTLTTIKANIGFEALQAMREASKTGGALGQVAVQELEALQSVLGSLDQKQSREQLSQNLNNIKTHYQNAMNALSNSQMGGGAAPSSSGVTPGGVKYTIIP